MINTVMQRALKGEFTLIAEIGVNYYEIAAKEAITPMEAAKRMIEDAKAAGIHAVKFQSYKAGTLAAKNSPSYWDLREEPSTSQYKLFQKYDSFGAKEYEELSLFCDSVGIEFLSTPFDREAVDYLEPLMNLYKISSSDLNNLGFVEYIAKKQKPIILSVGASDESEIRQTLQTIRSVNSQPIILMHCVLEYPTPYEHANLNKIVTLAKSFPDCIVGYSDHTKPDAGYQVIKTAACLGAVVVEKHFTLDKTLKGNDHYHAMDNEDAKAILKDMEFLQQIRGSGELICLSSELTARQNARRSLVTTQAIKAGTKLENGMLTEKRPGTGIAPGEKELYVGKTIKVDVLEDTILTKDMF